jgi:inner membrane protein
MDWSISWWVWILLGFGLALLEMTTPGGFYFIFFGIAALGVGVLSGFELVQGTALQFLFFSIIAVGTSLVFRKPLLRRFGPQPSDTEVDSLVGETAMALDDIEVEGFGRVELRGTVWKARNQGQQKVARGERCAVQRVDGLLLWVKS